MKNVLALLRSEPNAIGGMVAALIALAASFGFGLSTDQVGAITAVAAILSHLVVRQVVTPNVAPLDPTLTKSAA